MTTLRDLAGLAALTIKDPIAAAHEVLAYNLRGNTAFMALALVAVINALLFGLTNILVPPLGPIPVVFQSPFLFFGIVAGGVLVTAFALSRVGQLMGGIGTFADIFALLIWLQAMRAAIQGIVLVLLIIAPGFAAFLAFAAGIYGLWILVNFVSVGLQFYSLGRAAIALALSTVAIVFALVIFLTVTGVAVLGV